MRSSRRWPPSRPLSAASPSPSRPRSIRAALRVVSEEIGRLFGADAGAIVRYVDDAGRRGDRRRLATDRAARRSARRAASVRGRRDRARAKTGRTARIDLEAEPSDVRERMVAAEVNSAWPLRSCVGRLWGSTSISNSSDRRHDPARRRGTPREVHGLVAVALAQRRGPRGADRVAALALVDAADAERRRLERNLHDGAQQRLVSLSLALRLAESGSGRSGGGVEILAGAGEELALGLEELRELARGIHPAILTDRGLAPRSRRSPRAPACRSSSTVVPTSGCRSRSRLATFYVVSESLANVAKYADGERRHASTSPATTAARRRGLRRRSRRRGRRQGIGPARADRPGRGARRPVTVFERAGSRHDRAGRAPAAPSTGLFCSSSRVSTCRRLDRGTEPEEERRRARTGRRRPARRGARRPPRPARL